MEDSDEDDGYNNSMFYHPQCDARGIYRTGKMTKSNLKNFLAIAKSE